MGTGTPLDASLCDDRVNYLNVLIDIRDSL